MSKLAICPECGAVNGPARRACKQCGLIINLNAPAQSQNQAPAVDIPQDARPRPRFIEPAQDRAVPWSQRTSSLVIFAAGIILLTVCAMLAVPADNVEAVVWVAAPFVGLALAAIPATILTRKGHRASAAWLAFLCGLLLWPLWPLCLVIALVASEHGRDQ